MACFSQSSSHQSRGTMPACSSTLPQWCFQSWNFWPPSGGFESALGLVEYLIDPGVNLAERKTELISKVGDGFLAARAPPEV